MKSIKNRNSIMKIIENLDYKQSFIIIKFPNGVLRKIITNIYIEKNNCIKVEMGKMQYIIIELDSYNIDISKNNNKLNIFFKNDCILFMLSFRNIRNRDIVENKTYIEDKEKISTEKVDNMILEILKDKGKKIDI